MNCRHWLLLVGLLLCPFWSHAAICSASASAVNFGTVNPLASAAPTAQVTLNYTCTRQASDLLGVTLCFNIGPSTTGNNVNTRSMMLAGPPASTLSYQLYQDSSYSLVWGSQYQSGTTPVIIPLTLLSSGQTTGSMVIYAKLMTPQTAAAPGSYQDSFAGVTASVTSNPGLAVPPLLPAVCGGTAVASFPFSVLATVSKQCNITTTNSIDFGKVAATQTNITSNSSLGVACSNNTPYTIGLVPSNGNTSGSGVMRGSSGNTSRVPYQLSSTPGPTGTAWGSAAGNMVAGTGSGTTKSYPVYATVPGANFTPDNYIDTVTVNVTY